MSPSLIDLERDLARALEVADPERVSTVRRLIADQHPDAPLAAEASFRLGLEALFHRGDLDAAEEALRRAVRVKGSPFSGFARVSLGLVLFRQGKPQQAVFELRKAAGQKPPTLASAQALSFIVNIQRQTNAGAEAERSRAELFKVLEALGHSTVEGDAAMAAFWLGVEHKLDGRRDLAKKHIKVALDRGLSPELTERAQKLLREL